MKKSDPFFFAVLLFLRFASITDFIMEGAATPFPSSSLPVMRRNPGAIHAPFFYVPVLMLSSSLSIVGAGAEGYLFVSSQKERDSVLSKSFLRACGHDPRRDSSPHS